MAEATADRNDSDDAGQSREPGVATQQDRDRMLRIAGWHGTAVLAALTLFGVGDYWAQQSALVLAHIVALGNALVAATVLASIFHEWGHFAGARASGASSPVLSKPARFYFMFNFDMQNNSVEQFVWMSFGGMLANVVLVIAALMLVPISTFAGALFVAVLIAKAVNVWVFEFPVVMRTRESEDPQAELDAQLAGGFNRIPGYIAGALAWLVFV